MAEKPTYEELEKRIQELEQAEIKRKKAEKALQASEKRFRSIFEQAAVGVAQIVSKTGDFVRINQRYADIVGYTVEEMEKLTIQKISHPDDLLKELDKMQLLVDGEIHEFSMDKRYYHKNGTIVWVNLTASPMWETGEGPNYHVAVVEDITNRKLAEEALILSEQKLSLHFLQTPLGVIEWDLDFKVRAWNPAAKKIFGYTEGEILGKHASVIVPKKYKKHVDNIWASLLQQKGGTRSTNENITKKGETIFCQWFNTPIIDEAGNTIAVFSLVQDITERKRAEEELKESEERYKELFDRSLDCVYTHDFEGNFISANQTALDLFGYTKEEITSLNFAFLLTEDELLKAFNALRDIIKKGVQDGISEYKVKNKKGDYLYIESTGSLLYKDGKPHAIMGTARDITERKRAEEEKRKALEFTAEQSKFALIGQVAGKMAHDFNNVLMGIMGNAQLAIMNCMIIKQ